MPHGSRHDRPEQRRNAGDGQRVRRRHQSRHADPQERANNRHAPATRPAPPEAESAMVIVQEAAALRAGRHDASLCPLSRRARPISSYSMMPHGLAAADSGAWFDARCVHSTMTKLRGRYGAAVEAACRLS